MTFTVVIDDERSIESAFALRMEDGTATIKHDGESEEVDVESHVLVLSDPEQ